MAKYRWADCTIKYSNGSKFCYFNKITTEHIITDRHFDIEQKDIIPETMGADLFNEFLSKKLIIDATINEDSLYADILTECSKMRLEHLNLLVTEKCNLNCSYCQIVKNTFANPSIMTEETARLALNKFFMNCNKLNPITINITGGEPLTNFKIVKFIIEYSLNNFTGDIRLVIFTNGTLLDKSIAMFLCQHNVLVIVSLDGPKEMHDNSRRDCSGESTYEQSLAGYMVAKSVGCKCAISSVANKINLQNLNRYWEWVKELNPLSLGFNYPHLLLQVGEMPYDFKTYTDAIITLHRHCEKSGIYLENFERFKKVLMNKMIRMRECQACGRGITVRADGCVGPCKSLLVSDKILFEPKNFSYNTNEIFKHWATRLPIFNSDCKQCDAVTICGGGCAYDSYILFNGHVEVFDRRLCAHNMEIMKEILSDLCSQTERQTECDSLIESVGH